LSYLELELLLQGRPQRKQLFPKVPVSISGVTTGNKLATKEVNMLPWACLNKTITKEMRRTLWNYAVSSDDINELPSVNMLNECQSIVYILT
jgi:hypothetical protein